MTLEQAFKSPDAATHDAAVEALGAGAGQLDAAALERARSSEADPVRRHRLNQALAGSHAPQAAADLIASLAGDKDPLVRTGAAQELGGYPQSAGVVAALGRALSTDSAATVRMAAARSLALSRTDEATAALVAGARDADPAVRAQVAFALKRQDGAAAASALARLANDTDAEVRRMAGGAQ